MRASMPGMTTAGIGHQPRPCPDGTPVTPEFVIGSYHHLFEGEKSFRISKSDLQARSIYHRKHGSIEPPRSYSPPSPSVARSRHGRLVNQEIREDRTPFTAPFRSRSASTSSPPPILPDDLKALLSYPFHVKNGRLINHGESPRLRLRERTHSPGQAPGSGYREMAALRNGACHTAAFPGFLRQERREYGGCAAGGQIVSNLVEVQLADHEFVVLIDGEAITESTGYGDKVAYIRDVDPVADSLRFFATLVDWHRVQ
jgi:hypothetical protein